MVFNIRIVDVNVRCMACCPVGWNFFPSGIGEAIGHVRASAVRRWISTFIRSVILFDRGSCSNSRREYIYWSASFLANLFGCSCIDDCCWLHYLRCLVILVGSLLVLQFTTIRRRIKCCIICSCNFFRVVFHLNGIILSRWNYGWPVFRFQLDGYNCNSYCMYTYL